MKVLYNFFPEKIDSLFRISYICEEKSGHMKRIVLSILFLLAIVIGWNTVGECCAPVKAVREPVKTETGEATHHEDRLISVLTAANSCADISVRTGSSFSSNLARRYRPAGFSFDRLFEYLTHDYATISKVTLKTTTGLSQEYAARLKNAGYYIFTLRKIII